MPFVTRMMMPRKDDIMMIDPALLEEEPDFQKNYRKTRRFLRMEESRLIAWIIGILGFTFLGMYFIKTVSTSPLTP